MVVLEKPNEEEFRRLREIALNDYSHDGKKGTWPTAEIARQEFDRWFPDGVNTAPNQHLLAIRTLEGRHVGSVFLTVAQRPDGAEAFILSLDIFPEFRRQGYGEQALAQLDQYVINLGLDKISLSVFEENDAAKSLYAKSGYLPVFVRMTKRLKVT